MTDENSTATDIQIDGIWRVEPWHERFLVVRHVPVGETHAKREILSEGKFSSFALVFESQETAERAAEKANAAEEGAADLPSIEENDSCPPSSASPPTINPPLTSSQTAPKPNPTAGQSSSTTATSSSPSS